MPSELLWQWSRSRAGCGIRAAGCLGQAYATAPGRDRGRDWRTEAELRDCVRLAPAPRGHCASPGGSGRSLAAPPLPRPCASRRGLKEGGEAGGGSARAGERLGVQAAEEGGRGKRSGERVLTPAPRTLRLVLATSWGDDREKLAGASFPTGIKQVMASHLRGGCRCCCCSGQGAARSLSTRIPSLQATSGRAFFLLLKLDSLPEAPPLAARASPTRPPPPKSPAGRWC